MLQSLPLGGPAHFHAIVVGVGSQDDARIPATPNARRDADLVRRLLLDSSIVLPEDMLLLTDGGMGGAGAPRCLEPTRENLCYALDKWLGERFSVGDVVVVYYAGQGGYVVDEAHRAIPSFIPRDAKADRLAETALDATWVASTLRRLAASQLVLCYDTSFGGRGSRWQPEVDWRELHRLQGRDSSFLCSRATWVLSLGPCGVILGPLRDDTPTAEGRGRHGAVTLALARALRTGGDSWYGLVAACRANQAETRIDYPRSSSLLPHLRVQAIARFLPVVKDVTRLDRVLRVSVPKRPHTLTAIVGPLTENECRRATAVLV